MVDGTELKRRTMRTWGTGSYPTFGRHLLPAIARLVDSARVGTGDRVLDVACGHGNVAVTAHRRGGRVVGVDIAPAMLERARGNAAAAGIDAVSWHLGDAEALPYRDGAFDVVLSNVGHVIAPDPEATARELTRVCRPGGRLAFTAWTPDGPLPTVSATLAPYLPPAPETPSPALWSDPDVVRDRLGDRVTDLAFETDAVGVPAASVGDYWAHLVECSVPLQERLDRLDDAERGAARQDVLDALAPHFDGSENLLRMPHRRTTATRV